MYRRIRQALTLLKSVERYDTDEVDPDTWCGDGVAQAVNADCVDQVIRILEGVSDDETESEDALEILRGNSPASDRGLASRLLPDLAMILTGCRVGKNKSMRWLNVCRELGLTLKDLTDEAKRQGGTDAAE